MLSNVTNKLPTWASSYVDYVAGKKNTTTTDQMKTVLARIPAFASVVLLPKASSITLTCTIKVLSLMKHAIHPLKNFSYPVLVIVGVTSAVFANAVIMKNNKKSDTVLNGIIFQAKAVNCLLVQPTYQLGLSAINAVKTEGLTSQFSKLFYRETLVSSSHVASQFNNSF